MAANGLELTAIASASRTPRVVTSAHPDSQTSARGEEEPEYWEAEEREGEDFLWAPEANAAVSASRASLTSPLSVDLNPSREIIGTNAAYRPLSVRSSAPRSWRRRNCVSAGIAAGSSSPHVGVIHQSLHRAHATKRAQFTELARRRTWRLRGRTTPSSTWSNPRTAHEAAAAGAGAGRPAGDDERAGVIASGSTDSAANASETPRRIGTEPWRRTPSARVRRADPGAPGSARAARAGRAIARRRTRGAGAAATGAV